MNMKYDYSKVTARKKIFDGPEVPGHSAFKHCSKNCIGWNYCHDEHNENVCQIA